jgi:modulator of FtsH protease HflK
MALNDPQWGKKNNDGPPDLDELVRRMNRRIGELFGKRGNNAPSGGRPAGSRPWGSGLGLIALILLAIWLASGFYIVDASNKGIVVRFGKYLESTDPGLRWHLPWPIEAVDVVNVSQVRTVEVGYRNSVKSKVPQESLMLTDDENIIDIQFAVQYTVKDPKAYLFNNRAPDEAVLQSAETAIRQVVGKNKMDYVLYEGRADIANSASKLMQEILDRYQTGINVSTVTMQNAQPPEQVQAAFDDAVKAGQDRERQKSEGEAYANDVIPRARGAALRLLAEANGYQQRVIASAEGEASRFKQVLSEYHKAPAITRERLYLDTVQQVFASTSKVIIDQKSSGSLLYLPLDKLIGAREGTAAPSAADSTVSRPAPESVLPAPESATRSRDAFRSRERESR